MSTESNHFLYPLNPESDYTFIRNGRKVPTSFEGFFETVSYKKSDKWGVKKNAYSVAKGDWIWAHFALPISGICAVGQVESGPVWESDWGQYAIFIKWNKELTEYLKESGIPYSRYKQVPYYSVTAASPDTRKVLNAWLRDHRTKEAKGHDAEVRFRASQVEQRIGQPEFRSKLLRAYGNRCAVTGCTVAEVLQAAHIRPVGAKGTHATSNGILLRADIHNLFDRGLLTIDSAYVVHLGSSIRKMQPYSKLHGKKLAVIPKAKSDKPDIRLLKEHRGIHEDLLG